MSELTIINLQAQNIMCYTMCVLQHFNFKGSYDYTKYHNLKTLITYLKIKIL